LPNIEGSAAPEAQDEVPLIKNFGWNQPYEARPRDELTISPWRGLKNRLFAPQKRASPGNLLKHRLELHGLPQHSRVHSAAAASDIFPLADEIMKSEMRGRISDLNRFPLNTP
jgi:hypothetical protein